MSTWIRRTLALYLFPLGIAFLVFPFNDHRSGEEPQEVVRIESAGFISLEELPEPFAGLPAVDLSYPDLEAYPSVLQQVNFLNEEYREGYSDLTEWKRLAADRSFNRSDVAVIVFRAKVFGFKVNSPEGEASDVSDAGVDVIYLGAHDPLVKTVTEADLASYPSVALGIKQLESGISSYESEPIPREEYQQFAQDFIDPQSYSFAFNYNGSYFRGAYSTDWVQFSGTIPGLQTWLPVVGTVALAAGLMLFFGLYRGKAGILVNPQWVAMLWDGITAALLIVAAYPVADTMLVKILHLAPSITDDFSVFMGNFCFYFGAPFVALYTSRFTGQSVRFDENGIEMNGLGGRQFLSWSDFHSVDLSNEYVAVGRVGVAVPKKLQTGLKIQGKQGQEMFMNEPQLKSVKARISNELLQFLPQQFRDEVERKLKAWG